MLETAERRGPARSCRLDLDQLALLERLQGPVHLVVRDAEIGRELLGAARLRFEGEQDPQAQRVLEPVEEPRSIF